MSVVDSLRPLPLAGKRRVWRRERLRRGSRRQDESEERRVDGLENSCPLQRTHDMQIDENNNIFHFWKIFLPAFYRTTIRLKIYIKKSITYYLFIKCHWIYQPKFHNFKSDFLRIILNYGWVGVINSIKFDDHEIDDQRHFAFLTFALSL